MVHEGGWQFVRADETDEVMVLPPVPDHVGRARAPAEPGPA